MTTEQILYAGLTGCVAAIVFLFRLQQVHHDDTKADLGGVRSKLDTCVKERQDLSVRVAVLEVPARQLEVAAAKTALELKTVAMEMAAELRRAKE